MTLLPSRSSPPEPGNTAAVLVTYGSRYEFLSQVVQVLLDMGIAKIIIVDNGSPVENRSKVRRYSRNHPREIELIRLPRNTGSAGGFYIGLQCAQSIPSIEFVWMLDDDNKPKRDAFLRLCKAYHLLGNNPLFTLLSLRRSRSEYLNAATSREKVGIKCGSFLGFHVSDWIKERVSRRRVRPLAGDEVYMAPLVGLEYAPYGGFFFHKSWLARAGFPNKNFFLYSDDHEFTMRIRDNGGHIYLCAPSELDELEPSWGVTSGGPRSVPVLMRAEISEQKIYYFVRNRVYLEKLRCCGVRAIYWANMCLVLARVSILATLIGRSPKNVGSRLRLIVRAIKDGRSGKFME